MFRPCLALPLLTSLLAASEPIKDETFAQPRAVSVQSQERLMESRQSMGLSPDHSFKFRLGHRDERGVTHNRFHQNYRGVRIWGGEVITHTDPSGVEVKESTRKLFPSINIATEPVLTAKEALAVAHQNLNPQGAYSYLPTADLVVYPVEVLNIRPGRERAAARGMNAEDAIYEPTRYHLAYHIHTILENGVDPVTYMDYMVDAHTGKIIKKWSTLMNADVRGTGNGKYNGSVTLFTNSNGSNYELKDMTRGTGNTFSNNAVTNMNKGTSGNGTLYTDADSAWGDGLTYSQSNTTTSANGQTVAVDSAYGQQATWDMFKNMFGRNGMNGAGKATYIRVHYGNATADAFYSDACYCVALGDASGSLSDATSIQTVAHELGHSFCSGSSNLTYATGETGGLNESNSDITAAAAYFYVKRKAATGSTLPDSAPQNDPCWDLFSEEGPALRYMTKPSKDGTSPDAWSTSLNSTEQHSSSGPNNRMFFFLTSGASNNSSSIYYSSYTPNGFTGIGPDKAYRIWYKAMTSYLTYNSKYADARTACINAAQDLFGAGGVEEAAVWNAYAAINVGQPWQGISVSINPTTASLNTGGTQQFTATVTGTTSASVTWTCSGGSITTAGLYTAPSTTGSYTVTATSTADTAKSATATVTVTTITTPTITTQPASKTVAVGSTATFSVVASGTGLSYQWYKNNMAISGATAASYTTPVTTSSDNGATFYVKVSNSAGSVTSSTATLTVTTSLTYNEVESNGSISAANAVPDSATKIVGYIGTRTDNDYFKVKVGAGVTLTVNMTGPAKDYDLYLYNASGTQLKSSTGSTATETVSYKNSGTAAVYYYIRVKGYSGAYTTATPYNLALTR